MRWLNTHWRAAHVICLDFPEIPFKGFPEVDWEAPASAPAPGSARVLRVTCDGPYGRWYGTWPPEYASGVPAQGDLNMELPRWVAGVAPLCMNLTALHLRGIMVKALPELPLLVHVILEQCMFTPALVASLQGLARLETLHMSGGRGPWPQAVPIAWDVRACTRLRRVYKGWGLAGGQPWAGEELCLPPACTVALEIQTVGQWQGWLLPLGERVTDLRLMGFDDDMPDLNTTFLHAPQLSQLRHVTLVVIRMSSDPTMLCMTRLLRDLPRHVQSLHLQDRFLTSEQAVAVVPASLRALRVKGVCNQYACRQGCCCPPSKRTQDLTFGLHAGLERLCLVLWGARVDLQCLDAGAPASLQALNVQARVVDMDEHLAAEVARRGRLLDRCDVIDGKCGDITDEVPPVQVAYVGRGSVHMEFISDNIHYSESRVRHWACTCGTCAECLGPDTFGGVVDDWCNE